MSSRYDRVPVFAFKPQYRPARRLPVIPASVCLLAIGALLYSACPSSAAALPADKVLEQPEAELSLDTILSHSDPAPGCHCVADIRVFPQIIQRPVTVASVEAERTRFGHSHLTAHPP